MDGPILLHWKLNRARRACKEAMADLIAANKAMEEAKDVVQMAKEVAKEAEEAQQKALKCWGRAFDKSAMLEKMESK